MSVKSGKIRSVNGQENDKSFTWKLRPYDEEADFSFISAASKNLRILALNDIRYLRLSADKIDQMASINLQFSQRLQSEPESHKRIAVVMQTSIFNQLPIEHALEAFDRLKEKQVNAGDIVVTQSEEGNAYYIIEEGEARIIRLDSMTGEIQQELIISAGDAFGEEALIQNGYRNATITMTSPGKLLVLKKR